MKDFTVAKKAVKAEVKTMGGMDASKCHRIAMNVLREHNPNWCDELVNDMAWQVVMASR